MIFLETDRVLLREFEETDVSILVNLDSDPAVMKYLTDGRPSTLFEAASALNRILTLKQKDLGKFGVWIAIEKSTGNFMGWFLFRPCKNDPDNVKSIELGYRLKKQFWGKGFATEVSSTLIKKGFEELGVEIIWAKTMKRNLQSQKVMQKIGLSFECEFIENEFPGPHKEAVRYSLKR